MKRGKFFLREMKYMEDFHKDRLLRVCGLLREAGIAQDIISEPAALRYLTGEEIHQGERLTVLVIGADGDVFWVKNDLFTLKSDDIPVLRFQDGGDGIGTLAEHLEEGPVGVDKNWHAHFLLELMAKRPELSFVNGSVPVDRARGVKDAEEIILMREASLVNDHCLSRLAAWLREGTTENEAAAHLRALYREEGAEGVSFPPIIAYGPHGADPHHTTDDTPLMRDTTVLIDIGCKKHGYCSDMTRTLFFGDASEEMKKVHAIVCEAAEKAAALVRPGIPLRELDRAAREHIAAAGYGEYFTHRLGHFIGQTDHEAGEVSETSEIIAAPGMIFSIEPGIYLPGRFGVRIEDLVLVTEDGHEMLNHLPHGANFHNE